MSNPTVHPLVPAIWSLVRGILSLCGGCITGVPAIILK